jgi:hypothetical protein
VNEIHFDFFQNELRIKNFKELVGSIVVSLFLICNKKITIMKKLILICMTGVMISPAFGQNSVIINNNSEPATTNNTTKAESNSDEKSAGSFYLGFRFMPTISSFDVHKVDNSTIETSSVMSYGYGGLMGVNFSDNVGLQLEVIYSSIAQKYDESRGQAEIKLHYINVPLMLALNTNYGAPINFNIVAGPQIGINTGSHLDVNANGSGADTVNAVLAVKSHDLGVAYGAGVDFGFGTAASIRLSLGFRGVFGLIDVSDRSNSITTSEYYVLDRAHIKTYSAYIGLTFTL